MEDLTEDNKGDNDVSEQASQSNSQATTNQQLKEGESDGDGEDEDDEEDNSCVQVYFQVRDQNKDNWFHQKCCLMVIEAIIDEKMFDQLRTKEQLGYYVSAMSLDTRGVQGLCFSV